MHIGMFLGETIVFVCFRLRRHFHEQSQHSSKVKHSESLTRETACVWFFGFCMCLAFADMTFKQSHVLAHENSNSYVWYGLVF